MSEGSPGWSRKFEDPIALADGRGLVTLRDAADYITALPKKESDLPEWQAAIEVLMLVARGGPTMMARIGVMRALTCRECLHRRAALFDCFREVLRENGRLRIRFVRRP
jgi:hypothetical protein